MESIIKWQTGVPKETGKYLITLNSGRITIDTWYSSMKNWKIYGKQEILAWCSLSEIEPYKKY